MSEQSRGARAVVEAAERYGFVVDSERWYDGVAHMGTKYEVKSTTGRGFRIWNDQHKSLRAADARGSAWYVFVRFDGDRIVGMVRRKPSTVTRYVQEAGGWVLSGHDRRDGGGRERYLDPGVPF